MIPTRPSFLSPIKGTLLSRNKEILSQLREWARSKAYHKVTLSELQRELELTDSKTSSLSEALEELENLGEFVFLQARGWFVPWRENWFVGTLTIARKGFGFVRALSVDPRGDVFIPARRLKDAHHGDRVLVALERPRRGKPASAEDGRSGKILEVLERSPRVFPGYFRDAEGGAGIVEPARHESVREVWIDPRFRSGIEDGDRVLVRLRQGSAIDGLPPGEVLCAWAPEGTWLADLQMVCAEHGLREAFPREVEELASQYPNTIPEEEFSRRSDLRDEPFMTIDPVDAKDFDDALVASPLPEGGVRLGVAIADVSHFVKQGDPIDAEALLRGTSVYIPGKTIPMLPERLSNDLCSLRPNVDRLAKVAWMDIDSAGEFQNIRVEHAVIRSARRFTYEEVQSILDGVIAEKEDPVLVDQVMILNQARQLLHDRRIRQGSLQLEIEEMKLVLDDEGEVIDVVSREPLLAHGLVEECMLAANEAVATLASREDLPVLRRVHAPPDEAELEKFIKLCRVLVPEAPINTVTELGKLVEAVKGSDVAPVVFFALLRSLSRAEYSPVKAIHFALQKLEYCHFTSPIRRYPDLQVHQALDKHLFSGGAGPKLGQESVTLMELGESCSTRERAAESAERDMTRLRAISWLRHRVGERFPGIVTAVRDQGFYVRLDGVLVDGFVHVSRLRDDHYVYNETHFALRGINKGNMIRLGDPVEVELEGVDPLQRDVDLRYLHTRPGARRGKGAGGHPVSTGGKKKAGRDSHRKDAGKSGRGHRGSSPGRKSGGGQKKRRNSR